MEEAAEILSFVEGVTTLLDGASKHLWAPLWVDARIRFSQKFPHETFTTEHGAEFFHNLEKHLKGTQKYALNPEKGQNDKAYHQFIKTYGERSI